MIPKQAIEVNNKSWVFIPLPSLQFQHPYAKQARGKEEEQEEEEEEEEQLITERPKKEGRRVRW